MKKTINILLTLIIGAIEYYFTLPALNLNNISLYIFIASLLIIYTILDLISIEKIELFRKGRKVQTANLPKQVIVCSGILLGMFIIIMLANFICSPLFNAKSYQQRIIVKEDGNFTEDIEEVNFTQLPLLDRDSSEVLGDRVMGQVSELVSQYSVSNQYTQINYNNSIMRVTP